MRGDDYAGSQILFSFEPMEAGPLPLHEGVAGWLSRSPAWPCHIPFGGAGRNSALVRQSVALGRSEPINDIEVYLAYQTPLREPLELRALSYCLSRRPRRRCRGHGDGAGRGS